MKKSIKIAFTLLLLLTVIVIGLIWNLNSIVEKFRPDIEDLASKSIGQKVAVGKIQARLFPQVAIEVSDLQLPADHQIKTIFLETNLTDIFQKKLSISTFRIQDTEIEILHRADGSLSVMGIPIEKNKDQKKEKNEPLQAAHAPLSSKEKSASSFTFSLQDLLIQNVSVRYRNEKMIPPHPILINNINAHISHIDLSGSATIDLEASFLSSTKNLQLKGTLGDPTKEHQTDCTGELTNVSLSALSELLSAYKITANSLPFADPMSLKTVFKSEGKTLIVTSTVSGNKGPITIDLHSLLTEKKNKLKLTAPELIAKEVPITDLLVNLENTPTHLSLLPSAFLAFGGALSFEGQMIDNKEKTLSFALTGRKLQAGEISTLIKKSAITLQGTISALDFKTSGEGSRFKDTASGALSLDVKDGALQGINIFGQVLGKLKNIPGASVAVLSSVPVEFRSLIDGDTTPFGELMLRSVFSSGNAQINTFSIVHHLYEISVSGEVSFAGALKLRGKFKLTPVLTEKMLIKEPKLKLLLDERNNLVIPITIVREGTSAVVLPDVEDIFERAAKNTAKDAAEKALERVAPGLGGASKVLDSLFK